MVEMGVADGVVGGEFRNTFGSASLGVDGSSKGKNVATGDQPYVAVDHAQCFITENSNRNRRAMLKLSWRLYPMRLLSPTVEKNRADWVDLVQTRSE